ncbi:NAD-dependent epimerase/dehydratase family protein [Acholeplasma equirhinis]|uniref:NAD-dependent epimerase/dehydratase family protein n=1 Tax=Acholeplasma equirhinis TaxID=555393 RepID=UPI00197AE09E|nr:NAD-dependent epimerase/dehydratase family protein [Acholeplasma equirhinis]MBN3489968.1 NAD-dependent epimerase/dehydratase family protein [Acholeplasma equirhinis]
MKRILITGANSYVGTNVEKWLLKEPDKYLVKTLDMKDPNWINLGFSRYDVVYHVAGIAHVSSKKSMEPLYFKVNRDLAIETANKAKVSGVKQFIFMSSMIIYGKDNKIGDFRHVDINKYAPINAYGQSKLETDLSIQKMQDENFKVVIIRTPVVYGPGSKGNFPKLQKLALKAFLFPNIKNQRSMIYIDNLAELIKQVIYRDLNGIFYPQNDEYLSTLAILETTRLLENKKLRKTRIFNWLIKCKGFFIPFINKVFGNKTYNLEISNYDFNYRVVKTEQSIRMSRVS